MTIKNHFKIPNKLKCILHIGTEKTGTSSIQHYLSNNRDVNEEQGVSYLKLSGNGSQFEFAAAVADIEYLFDMSDIFSINEKSSQRNFKFKLQKDIYQQLFVDRRDNNISTLIISSEHFHSRLRSLDAIQRLKDFLDPFIEQYSVVMYVRRQVEMATSHYSTRLKHGQFDIPVLPKQNKQHESLNYYFNFNAIYDNWSSIFGADSMLVSIYRRENLYKKNVVIDFCQLINIKYYDVAKSINVNTSVNAIGLAYMNYINYYLFYMEKYFPTFTKVLRPEVGKKIGAIYHSKTNLVTQEDAANFMDAFTLSNNALLTKIKPQNKTLFDSDFSTYPTSLPVINLNKIKALALLSTVILNHLKIKIQNNTTFVNFVRKYPALKKMLSYLK
jgi:hypothetical protein